MVFVAVVLALPATLVAGEQSVLEYGFDRPELTPVKIEGVEYQRIVMPDCSNGGEVGAPSLPAWGARVLILYGMDATNIEVRGEKVSLGSGYLIEPVAPPMPLQGEAGSSAAPTPNPAIYAAAVPVPATVFEEVGTFGFRGYQILILKLNPVEYVPATGELSYYPNLTVVVECKSTGRSSPLFRGLASDAQEIATRVDNPAAVSTYPAPRGEGGYDLLIITTPTFASTFQPLKDYHDSHGLLTQIHTTADIGSTDPDDLRAYITSCYTSDGISYVIIGGDDDIIPAKDLYVEAGWGGYIETAMPGDIYFGCLDGTWNYDGDSYWGEPTDGPGGGDVDLVAEVYVGRACGSDITEIGRFVDKTLWYLNGGHKQPDKVLLVGEYLGFGGDSEYGANTLEELIDGCGNHGYTTVGIPSSEYTVDELFERDMSWSQSDLVARIDAGVHFLNHLGHGNVGYAMKLYNSDILNDLTNANLCFVYSQTCLAGHFDNADCWAETMNVKTDRGAFAVIMNARYGWGEYNTTDGVSQRFNREFWDAVFGEDRPELGRANHDSKEDNIYRINEACMRWSAYALNLFGDPSVSLLGTPMSMRVTPLTDFASEGLGGGPFAPASVDYTVENQEETGIDYGVSASASWLTIANGSGYLDAGASAVVTVSINSNADPLPDGSYVDTVQFTNVTNHIGDTTRAVTLKVGGDIVDDVAGGEILVEGTVTGAYMDTWVDDGVYEVITERDSGGKPSNRYSYLEHKWTFHVTGGTAVTFSLNAYHDESTDGDDFSFAYSTNDVDYVELLTLMDTSADGGFQSAPLPPATHGTVYIRVVDTDRTPGNRVMDSVYIDHMFIRSETMPGDPPLPPSGLAATAMSNSQIDLTWTDNSDDEYGFEVERWSDGSPWEWVDTVGADVTTYPDTGLTPDTTYYYRVRAFNGSGASSYSDEASATTLESPGIVLEGVGFILGGKSVVDLTWSGAVSADVELWRNGVLIDTTTNDGLYRDNLGRDTTGSFTYWVCEPGGSECSNMLTIVFE